MAIDPLKTNANPTPDAARLRSRATEENTRAPVAEREVKGNVANLPDRLEVSAESRELVSAVRASDAPAGSSGLSPERMKQVLERVESGYYDRSDVQATVARRVSKDLGTE